ncbi:hypothetical protein JCM33374_g4093 [Metschnikowia sp. JCM 33374]|nr:hypothetical protein JCM33374_g4093 [Metschnikowia sp. JCM 33374]
MTRTKKWTVHEKAAEPRYFTHNGHWNTDPHKVSKNGRGKFNWGQPGDEYMDENGDCATWGSCNWNHAANEEILDAKLEKCEEKIHLQEPMAASGSKNKGP